MVAKKNKESLWMRPQRTLVHFIKYINKLHNIKLLQTLTEEIVESMKIIVTLAIIKKHDRLR